MPAQPTVPPTGLDYATNVNYAGGDDVGTATKSEPAAGRKADGWRGNVNGDKPPAQEFNWWQHWAAKWLGWLFDVLTVGHDDSGVHRVNTIDSLQIVDEAVIRSKLLEESSNFVINPDAHMGDDFWWDGGAPIADYNTPGTNPDQASASFTVPNFLSISRNTDLSIGTFFTIVPATAVKVDLSEKIDLIEGQEITLSFLSNISAYVAGTMNIDVVCYDATEKFQGIICSISLSANENIWTFHEATGTTLANGVSGATADTAYIRVRRWIDSAADAGVWRATRFKCNGGILATSYSDEASKGQNLSARYDTAAGQGLNLLASTIIDFGTKTFDDPGTDRVTNPAGAWKFTADRYMKVRVSAIATSTLNVGLIQELELYYTPNGGAAALYSRLAGAWITAVGDTVGGTDIIELNEGDAIDVRFKNNSVAPDALTAVAAENYIAIEEIN